MVLTLPGQPDICVYISAVYLHHDGSIQSNVFCSQLLANHAIIAYLSSHYVTWAWDVTSDYNKEKYV